MNRFIEGARLQRTRLADAHDNAPRLLEGEPHEVVDLTSAPRTDLDYYIYELVRIRDAAREVVKVFDKPAEVVDALALFDGRIPKLRSARNPLTHASNDARLDDVGWFSALVRLLPNGDVEYLVDPRHDHDAVEELTESLLAFLRAGLRST